MLFYTIICVFGGDLFTSSVQLGGCDDVSEKWSSTLTVLSIRTVWESKSFINVEIEIINRFENSFRGLGGNFSDY